VKGAQVEFVGQGAFGSGTQLSNLEFADLVRQRLSRVGHIALDLGGRLGRSHRGVLQHPIDTLGDVPAHGVQTRVDHQPIGAQIA
jgi:hypothetical protein